MLAKAYEAGTRDLFDTFMRLMDTPPSCAAASKREHMLIFAAMIGANFLGRTLGRSELVCALQFAIFDTADSQGRK